MVRVGDLVSVLDAAGLRGDGALELGGATHDSRRVAPGDLYCCVVGSRSDGHEFAPDAVAAGAGALLVERWLDVAVPQIRVPDVRRALGPASAAVFGHPSRDLTVIGVTGTNGKTTTTYLLEAIARAAGLVPAVIGTVETRIGGRPVPGTLTTPEAPDLQRLLATVRDDGGQLVAMEVSSHALDLGRVDGTEFAAAVFTNLSHDHLDFHGTLDAYFEAKAELFDPQRSRAAAVNLDDEHGAVVGERSRDRGLPTVTFSVDPAPGERGAGADLVARDVRLDVDASRFRLVRRDGPDLEVTVSLVGSFNVSNALAAAAGALAAGLPVGAVIAGLAAPTRVPGRLEPVERGQDFGVFVDYAHTPDALARVLEAAREIAGPAHVAVVFGCGGDRDRAKRPEMGRVASEGADLVVVTSDNPRSEDPDAIIEEVLGGFEGAVAPVVEPDRRAAIRDALSRARPGDVVIVAGKGHESGQTVGDTVLPFDDRAVVAEELEALRCA